jgi:predicted N-formylglutamate amidohydrolase
MGTIADDIYHELAEIIERYGIRVVEERPYRGMSRACYTWFHHDLLDIAKRVEIELRDNEEAAKEAAAEYAADSKEQLKEP